MCLGPEDSHGGALWQNKRDVVFGVIHYLAKWRVTRVSGPDNPDLATAEDDQPRH